MAHVPSFTNFDPETAATLGAAYDEAVGQALIALAERGERNVHKLCDEALIAEGFLN
jgi:hypothetical protein